MAEYCAPTLDMSFSTASLLAASLGDRYRIDRKLGRGGMASVYLAHDRKHDRQVAVKVLRAQVAASLGPERFEREIKLAARLQHPHILTVLDSGEAGGRLWYTMPFVDGSTLRERLQREKQLPIEDAIGIAREVASALAYAHAEGVVHRDIKPENILLSNGHAVVADFGIARALGAGSEVRTGPGVVLGTVAYMSPEQWIGDPLIDGRADIYSLGCVLFEMLAGKPPHSAPTAYALMKKRAHELPPSLCSLRASVTPALDSVVQRALARLPDERHATATAFARALAVARDEGTTGASAPVERASIAVLPFTKPSGDRAMRAPTATAVEAYELYLRGRQLQHQARRRTYQHAIEMYERAIAVDPGFAPAHAGIADCHSFLYMWHGASAEDLKAADNASSRALQHDGESAEARASRGLVLSLRREFEAAKLEFQRAIDIAPSLFEAHYFFGRSCMACGDFAEAARHFADAANARPDDFQARSLQALALAALGIHDEALAASAESFRAVRRHLELYPHDPRAIYFGAGTLVSLGHRDRGLVWAERALAIDPLDEAILYNVACVFARAGDVDRSLELLERASRNGKLYRDWVEHDEDLASLRGHPRFASLIART